MRKHKKVKLPFGISEEFINSVATMDVAARKEYVARLESNEQDAREFMKTNEEIVNLTESLKELKAGPQETIKASRNRKKYIVDELKAVGEFGEPQAEVQN